MGKLELRPNLKSKHNLVQDDLDSNTIPLKKANMLEDPQSSLTEQKTELVTSNVKPVGSLHLNNLLGTGMNINKAPKPSLFNKSLLLGSSNLEKGSLKPTLFCTTNLLPTTSLNLVQKPQNASSSMKEEKPKTSKRLQTKKSKKRNSLENQNLRGPSKVTKDHDAGKITKRKKKIVSDKSQSKKKIKEAQFEIITASIKELKLTDNEFKRQQLEVMRNKLKAESENLFTDSKQGSYDAIKQEKEKIIKAKQHLINMVSMSLLHAPKIGDVMDQTRIEMMKAMKEMSEMDPEFILKLALYTRKVLNVRVVSTFMVAFAAYVQECRPYLKKYFNASIVLPSDWIGAAELYQTFFDSTIKFGSIPTVLRKVMIEKFSSFDEYQLAKYNKEKSQNKAKAVTFYPHMYEFMRSESQLLDEDGDNIKEYELKSLSLKQLIRKLHISQPSQYVMCLVGKKYPSSIQEFYQSHLPGNFDEGRAGKRMKLKTPETWETQVSLKGNKATTWQDLLDHKKLPFMAMLRNLRNMISAGMKEKYHNMIIHRLTDEKSVKNSKQFPFRFLSAYDIIELMEKSLETGEDLASVSYKKNKTNTTRSNSKPLLYSHSLLMRYKKALEKSLKISTLHNISPIPGMTVIIIDIDEESSSQILTKSISPVQRNSLNMGLLLGVMCNFHCEESLFILNDRNKGFTILNNVNRNNNIMDSVHEAMEEAQHIWRCEPIVRERKEVNQLDEELCDYLGQFVGQRRVINNFYMVGTGSGWTKGDYLKKFVDIYRKEVNPTTLVIRQCIQSDSYMKNCLDSDYDVFVVGYSDQVLKYLGERGTGRQLTAVENIDMTFNLDDIKVRRKKRLADDSSKVKIERPILAWKTIRVFISSTFRDMHGERDLLTKYVFPELRCWCYNYCLNLYEVDLRWGITERQSQSDKQLELCLSEVQKADLFVGMLGERFGWVPTKYKVEDEENLGWVKDMPKGCSMTELEMRGFLREDSNASKALFLFRDPEFLSDVPPKVLDEFVTQDSTATERIQQLKEFIKRQRNVQLIDNYPCKYGGKVDNKVYTADLEDFGRSVLTSVWEIIKTQYIDTQNNDNVETSTSSIADKHVTFAKENGDQFVGRKSLLTKVSSLLHDESSVSIGKNVVGIVGKSGSGKSAFMAKLVQNMKVPACCYFSEAGTEYQHLSVMLKYIFHEINTEFDVGMPLPENEREQKVQFENLLKSVSKVLRRSHRYYIFVDGLESMEKGRYAHVLDWIPDRIPLGIYFVISCLENGPVSRLLSNHQQCLANIKLGPMEHPDRTVFVRNILQKYGKSLDESPFNNQMRLLLSKKGAESPLYLKLACEEIRLFGIYEKVSEYLKALAQTTPQLIEFVLNRIEKEYGSKIVKNVFTLLHHSRQGLTEDELYETLNFLANVQEWNETSLHDSTCYFDKDMVAQKVPRATFVCLCREMKTFLNEDMQSGTITLMHKEIIAVIEKRYASDARTSSLIHFVLASFYRKQCDPNNDMKWHGKDIKALTELPFHMASSGLLWDDFKEMMTSVYFIKAKVENNLARQLLDDLHLNLPLNNAKWLAKKKDFLGNIDVKDITQFITNNLDILAKYPTLLLQLAVNSPDGSFMQTESAQIPTEDVLSIMKWLNKPDEVSTCTLSISNVKSSILSISLSRDGKHVACGTEDGHVFVYDKESSKEIHSFSGHSGAITACCYAGDKLCSASTDSNISIWDLNTGHRLHSLSDHREPVTGCVVTRDGKLLVTVSLDKTARLWNVNDGSAAGFLAGLDSPLNCVAMDTEDKHAALGGWNKCIVIWNILENKKIASYNKGHKSSVRALAYSPNGSYLASSGLNGELLLWSTQSGAMIGQLSELKHHVRHISFSTDGLQLFGASDDSSIKIWSGTLGCPERQIDDMDEGDGNTDVSKQHNEYALSVCVSDHLVAIGYNSGKVSVYRNKGSRYHVAGHERLISTWKAHSSSVRSMCFLRSDSSEYKKDLVTASDDYKIIQWALKGRDHKQARLLEGHTNGVTCVRAKEAYIISSSKDCSLRVWNAISFEAIGHRGNRAQQPQQESSVATLHGHTGIVTGCDLSPCETKAISCGHDRALYIWDLTNFTSLCVVHNAHGDGITACCWSDVGTYVVTGSNDFKLKLWNTKVLIENKDEMSKLKERSTFIGHTTTINDVKYKFGCVVSSSADGRVKVWNQNGVEITTFQPHKTRINSADLWAPGISIEDEEQGTAWSTRTKDLTSIQQRVRAKTPKNLQDILLFTASDDGTTQSWRPFKPDLLNELYGHSNVVSEVKQGSNGELISGSLDETIKVWDFKLSKEEDNGPAHSGEVTSIALHNNDTIATAGRDGRINHYIKNELTMTYITPDLSPVTTLAFRPDGKRVYFGTSSGRMEWLSTDNTDHCEFYTRGNCPVLSMATQGSLVFVCTTRQFYIFTINGNTLSKTRELCVSSPHTEGDFDKITQMQPLHNNILATSFNRSLVFSPQVLIKQMDRMLVEYFHNPQTIFVDRDRDHQPTDAAFSSACLQNDGYYFIYTGQESGCISLKVTSDTEMSKKTQQDILNEPSQSRRKERVENVDFTVSRGGRGGRRGRGGFGRGRGRGRGGRVYSPPSSDADEWDRGPVEDDWGPPNPIDDGDWGRTDEEIKKQDELYERDLEMEDLCNSSRKIHDSAVTGILIYDDVMVTSSKDATIKIWKYASNANRNLGNIHQIGLFSCRSSVISMAGYGDSDGVHLIVGDRIGNVEFLKLNI